MKIIQQIYVNIKSKQLFSFCTCLTDTARCCHHQEAHAGKCHAAITGVHVDRKWPQRGSRRSAALRCKRRKENVFLCEKGWLFMIHSEQSERNVIYLEVTSALIRRCCVHFKQPILYKGNNNNKKENRVNFQQIAFSLFILKSFLAWLSLFHGRAFLCSPDRIYYPDLQILPLVARCLSGIAVPIPAEIKPIRNKGLLLWISLGWLIEEHWVRATFVLNHHCNAK